jgi:hypothetical protein
MGDVASDRTALELLRVQRGRLADRMRPPWWYFPGIATVFFAGPFSSRSYSSRWRLAPGPSWSPQRRSASCCSGE